MPKVTYVTFFKPECPLERNLPTPETEDRYFSALPASPKTGRAPESHICDFPQVMGSLVQPVSTLACLLLFLSAGQRRLSVCPNHLRLLPFTRGAEIIQNIFMARGCRGSFGGGDNWRTGCGGRTWGCDGLTIACCREGKGGRELAFGGSSIHRGIRRRAEKLGQLNRLSIARWKDRLRTGDRAA